MIETKKVEHHVWSDVTHEKLNPTLYRRMIWGEQVMLAHIELKKGCVVPLHHHENEQFSYILTGALRFEYGEGERESVIVRAGEVLQLPSNVPHTAEALEDSLSLDVFSPPRQDWIDGTDMYLRQE
jgi:quercetin dioxygenase-like cupin family protein